MDLVDSALAFVFKKMSNLRDSKVVYHFLCTNQLARGKKLPTRELIAEE